ncbi:Dnaj-like protein [Thalictrum thalictroides]|uniref:Dnaj-like protein n=1 Tax=Thalictrum thalictroides TaxID=46969 RepID=A0A7J6WD75_THATH|nr:Dnaj-like protein [Thalictrum thalictroides]
MARKGNHQRNSLDHNSSNLKVKNLDSCGGSLPERGHIKEGVSKVNKEEIVKSQTGSPSVERSSKTKNSKDEKKSNQKSKKALVKEKPGPDRINDPVQLAAGCSSPRDCEEDASGFDVSQLRGSDRTSPGSEIPKNGSGCSRHGIFNEDVRVGSRSLDTMSVESLRASVLSIFKAASRWLESKRPLFTAIMSILSGVGDYICLKTLQAYPIVSKWLVHIGNLLLLIFMIWLYCSIRGFISFLRLGTTSFFVVIWCSTLSVIAMIGILKLLIFTGVMALAAFFVSLTLAALLATILATLFLWMYGSFWTTGFVSIVGGLGFVLHYERFSLLITTIYSVYCAKTYVGWVGLLLGLNLSFISSDVLIHYLKNNMNEHSRSSRPQEETEGMRSQPGSFFSEPMYASTSETSGRSTDRNSGVPSTSGEDSELTSEDEVVRLLNCTDHYSALGLSRYENVDVSLLKREYRRKAMLVHPDKNMGNEKAAEAFKKLQNAYEILLDSLKRKAYDDELRREELLNWFHRSQNILQKDSKNGIFSRSATENEDLHGESRRIACKKCGSFHIWVHINRSKSRARWCQDCNDFHQAKDGDGWVEQSSQPFFFGLLQKVDVPSAYICAESRIYDATEWFICQGMRCPANAHKPSFHVNTSVASKHGTTKGGNSGQRGSGGVMIVPENLILKSTYNWLYSSLMSNRFAVWNSQVSFQDILTKFKQLFQNKLKMCGRRS